ncbi:MAG: rhomboid family intramembrane serine protease [Terrimicrobiaceae bacterium]|jgi:membrane associated rhomboid family serine protease
MIADRNSGNTSPLTWVGSFPVYASTVLAAAHAATMVLTALALAVGAEALIQSLQFSSRAVLENFALWQFVTYAFVHPPDPWFLLEIYLLVMFGREIEMFLGRNAFLRLYALLLLLPPLVLTMAGLGGHPTFFMGSSALHFGVFIAFATLYPRAQILFGIQAGWIAFALLSISALKCLADSMTTSLVVLVLDSAAAFATIKLLCGTWSFDRLMPRRSPPLRVVQPERGSEHGIPPASIDAILEKISKSGMGSLTSRERAQLEKARAELLEKDRTH